MLPIRFPDFFQGVREPWKGILLYGPPGTGKTFLAKACASECDATFFSISSSDLMSKYVGETERLIRQLFEMAREQKPAIIFIDEVDSMTGNRSEGENESSRRAKTEFLVQMQGVGKDDTGILVLGATNLPWALDPAIRRRFERRVYIPLPDYSARLWMFQNKLKDTPHSLTEGDFQQLAYKTEGYSGSDVTILVRDASFQPLRKCQNALKFKQIQYQDGLKYSPCAPSDPQGVQIKFLDIPSGQVNIPDIQIDDFLAALVNCKPSVAQDDLQKYEEFTEKFGQQD
eukprot:TRINITY_DN1012_c0_g1_i1.p1 TRINITY_DN1012_c0_g1~~TRINITY_DN1012_c0_g1_i1.p1  ORF type:complete len:286 (-),score=37.54 TRINITY_DN1012_c0_g1_i1:90-947(-)